MKFTNEILVPKYLKMPKPLEKYSREKISKEFFTKRIEEISLLIQNRRDIRLVLTFCVWLQADRPETLNDFKISLDFIEKNSKKVSIEDLKNYLNLIDEKINMQQLPTKVLEFYKGVNTVTNTYQIAQFVQMDVNLVKLVGQIILHLNNPVDPAWDYIEDIFILPKLFNTYCYNQSDLWKSDKFEKLSIGSRNIIKLIYHMFTYFSDNLSGIHEHFLRISALLFWITRPEPVYALEIYSLLTEMFPYREHKLNTRSSQLCDRCNSNVLISCEKKGGSKNRSVIYFSLSAGAEWIITCFFPDKKIIIQQQAIAISFLRYSKQILTCPWTINPMDFNYLMDIWFRSFLFSDNLDQIVYKKALELRRKIYYQDILNLP